MKRTSIWWLGAALCITVAAAPSHAAEQVLTHYAYAADAIYPVRTGLGITTQIELSPNEKILDYSTGFSSGWDLTRRENVFYLKPKNVDVDTNMMVRTATHSYIFELKVVATDWKTLAEARRDGVQYKITFIYPADTSFSHGEEAAARPAQDSTLLPDRSYNFDYDYATRSKAAPWLVPVNVYDDSGKTTFMKSLVNHIPDDERLVTIEDARELFIDQPNVVHLLYSKGGQSASHVTAKSCMEACLRMKARPHHPGRTARRRVVLFHPQLRLGPSRLDHQLPCRQHRADLGPARPDGQGLQRRGGPGVQHHQAPAENDHRHRGAHQGARRRPPHHRHRLHPQRETVEP
ncbi:hypothetical protein RLIN73S_03815 [Rhodanobacter lindaniclasticus]